MWIPFDRENVVPYWNNNEIYAEELYDHRGEALQDFTHREVVNLINQNDYTSIKEYFRNKMKAFIAEVIYLGLCPYSTKKLI
jgi:predicted adenine nucleotide alpha hydrolase (AANH) superfamily ATPase